jgi:Amt family ammonium transporter
MVEWKPDSGDTAWILLCTALLMLMTPGLALFYGGMVRRKNVLGTMMQSWFLMGIISVEWAVLGYSLAFDKGKSAFIGGLAFAFLPWSKLGGPAPFGYGDTIPHMAFAVFQMMFAILTPALIFGAVADRMKFKAMVLFGLLWSVVIYNPLAHMVWGAGGFLHGIFIDGKPAADAGMYPALDFAGGMVVHISSGVAGLVCCLVIGKRVNYEREPMPPHSMVLSTIGAGLLWFGWFGFIGGNAGHANSVAATAFFATQLAAAAATISWVLVEWRHRGHPSLLGGISGAVAGLVAITPAAGFVEPISAFWIGALAGAVCYGAVAVLKAKLDYDDSLDTFGLHGIGGIVGAILTGAFATSAVNPGGANGLFKNNGAQFVNQIIAVLATISFTSIGTFILLKVVDSLVGLRITKDEELEGLDLTQHREVGYNM